MIFQDSPLVRPLNLFKFLFILGQHSLVPGVTYSSVQRIPPTCKPELQSYEPSSVPIIFNSEILYYKEWQALIYYKKVYSIISNLFSLPKTIHNIDDFNIIVGLPYRLFVTKIQLQ